MIRIRESELSHGLAFLTVDGERDLVHDLPLRPDKNQGGYGAFWFRETVSMLIQPYYKWLDIIDGTILWYFTRIKANVGYTGAGIGYYISGSDTQTAGWQEAGAGNTRIQALFRRNSYSANYTYNVPIGTSECVAARFSPTQATTFRNGYFYNDFTIINGFQPYPYVTCNADTPSVMTHCFAVWNRQLSDHELARVTRNPYELITEDLYPVVSQVSLRHIPPHLLQMFCT